MALCVLCPTESAQEQDDSVSVELPLRLQPKAQFFQQLPTGNFQNLSTIISTTTLRSRFGQITEIPWPGVGGCSWAYHFQSPQNRKRKSRGRKRKLGGGHTKDAQVYICLVILASAKRKINRIAIMPEILVLTQSNNCQSYLCRKGLDGMLHTPYIRKTVLYKVFLFFCS